MTEAECKHDKGYRPLLGHKDSEGRNQWFWNCVQCCHSLPYNPRVGPHDPVFLLDHPNPRFNKTYLPLSHEGDKMKKSGG